MLLEKLDYFLTSNVYFLMLCLLSHLCTHKLCAVKLYNKYIFLLLSGPLQHGEYEYQDPKSEDEMWGWFLYLCMMCISTHIYLTKISGALFGQS